MFVNENNHISLGRKQITDMIIIKMTSLKFVGASKSQWGVAGQVVLTSKESTVDDHDVFFCNHIHVCY